MRRLIALTLAALLVSAAPGRAGSLDIDTLATRLVEDLSGYVNREYARQRVRGTLVLTSNPQVRPAADDARAIHLVTLERRPDDHGQLVPLLIERTILVAPAADGRWWLVDVRSVVRTLDEDLDRRLGPYLEDIPKPTDAPNTIVAASPYVSVDGAFNQAIRLWLRDVQLK